VAVRGNDEIAELAASFNAMSEVLERRVKARTLELSEANASLSASNRDLAEALERLNLVQEQIVASEKLAVLGKLAANIAHELNTPLAAIRSSAGQLLEYGREFLASLPGFVGSLGERDKSFFDKLARRGLEHAEDISGAQDRARRRAVASRFAAAGLPNPESLADDLESLSALDLEEEAASVVSGGRPDIVSVAARLGALFRAEAIIRSAADKAALTVSALTDYSRRGDAETPVPFDLIEAIETLLVLYYNATKRSVRIVRHFECRDPALGSRERLDHVWVNLIDNALEAMRYEGSLEIATRRSGERILVSFADSGPGIPDEIRDSVFEPFFTTKKSGEGTGLGLDICRKIVEDYGGSIGFESEPGRTVFTVSLPAAGPLGAKDGPR
jgi:C4-dicarboxylate-specific signal transduction histidine kinase